MMITERKEYFFSRKKIFFPLFLIAASLLVYSNSFNGPFFFDDVPSIPENPHIRSLWPFWKAMIAPAQTSLSGRPVVSLSFAINYALGGLRVWTYHAGNLLIHLLCGLALFGLARRTFQTPVLKDRFGKHAEKLAFGISLLWLAHPLNTEAVNYLIQRTELVVALFFLLTHYCAIRGIQSRKKFWYFAAVLSCALGMASKEVMAGAPLLVLLFDRTFVSRSFGEALRKRKWFYFGLASTWLILAALVAGGPRNETTGLHFSHLTSMQYLFTQNGVILHYLRLALWPHPLVTDYFDWPVANTAHSILIPGFFIFILLVLTLFAIWRNQPSGFSGAWFFMILAPTSSFVPIITEIAAERRVYLPLAALVAFGVLSIDSVAGRFLREEKIRNRAVGIFLIGLGLCYGFVTHQRNSVYQNEISIWEDVLSKRPANARAHNNLGLALYSQGRWQEAVTHYSEALRLKAGYVDPYINLGNVFLDRRQYEKAVPYYQKALKLKPKDARALTNLGSALFHLGHVEEAVSYHKKAMKLAPDYPHVYNNLGAALMSLNKLDEAAALFREAIRLRPDFAEPHSNLGSIDAAKGKYDEAIYHYREAVRLKPDYGKAYNNFGNLLIQLGKLKEAVEMFQKAIRFEPNYAEAHNNLAVAYAELGRLEDAAKEYEEALRLKPDSAEMHANFANILMDQDRIDDAVLHYNEALRLKPNSPDIQKKLEQARDRSR